MADLSDHKRQLLELIERTPEPARGVLVELLFDYAKALELGARRHAIHFGLEDICTSGIHEARQAAVRGQRWLPKLGTLILGASLSTGFSMIGLSDPEPVQFSLVILGVAVGGYLFRS